MGGFAARRYQRGVMEAVVRSVLEGQGRSIVVMFPRQSGKNELQAQIEAFLLFRLQYEGAEMVKISPTWKPQSLNAMRRLERVLREHFATAGSWTKESSHIYRLGKARILFLSGAPETNIVGATASTLLQLDEAQDIEIDKFDRDIAPMAASTNATRVFWGTAWTSATLLARELEAARQFDRLDLSRSPTAFTLTADEVGAEIPEYARHVAEQVRRLGRFHPMVRTQYYSETIDGQGGMFPPERVRRMLSAAGGAPAGCAFALLVDVGGEYPGGGEDPTSGEDLAGGDPLQMGESPGGLIVPGRGYIQARLELGETPGAAGGRRDATALTVVAVDLSGRRDPTLRAPVYTPVERRQWTGAPHTGIYAEIRALAAQYLARWVVVDATGIGAGLASFLERALPGRVERFLFTTASKSKLGWDFIALIDAGRWRELAESPPSPLQRLFFQQAAACRLEVLPGPGKTLRWGVPDGLRDPLTGGYLHDDLLISAALSSVLDRLDWRAATARGKSPGIVQGKDPLEDMNGF